MATATFLPEPKPAAAFLASSSETRGVHLGVLQLADEFLHLRAVGAQRLRLQDLPVVLVVLAELDLVPLACSVHPRQLVGIEGEQPLVAQILVALVDARLDELAIVNTRGSPCRLAN